MILQRTERESFNRAFNVILSIFCLYSVYILPIFLSILYTSKVIYTSNIKFPIKQMTSNGPSLHLHRPNLMSSNALIRSLPLYFAFSFLFLILFPNFFVNTVSTCISSLTHETT